MTFLLLLGFALAAGFFPRTTATLFVLLLVCGGCVEVQRGATADAIGAFVYAALITTSVVFFELQVRRSRGPTSPP